ncbi:hypothetical protein [Rhizobium sp. Root1220]|uniref:hypothetical protein n=1 Tax=Rhizobium sp. Root1220 TaxID=1736432 RepID=UPI0012E3F0EA|nr:hypothetical protein [Rhizobium sp. Root1220]
MTIRFFKQTRWFEVYCETTSERNFPRFYDRLSQGDGNHEFWFLFGRLYLALYVPQPKSATATVESVIS